MIAADICVPDPLILFNNLANAKFQWQFEKKAAAARHFRGDTMIRYFAIAALAKLAALFALTPQSAPAQSANDPSAASTILVYDVSNSMWGQIDGVAKIEIARDGIESCNADPCALARELEKGGIDFTTHVVGFDVAAIQDQRQLIPTA